MAACGAGSAAASEWHLDSSFGRHGVAGLAVREQGSDSLYGPGPGDEGSLVAPGPHGSLFVGGYAHSKPGSFLVSELSAQGRLVTGFGGGGVTVVPAIYSTPQEPPRLFALASGKLVIVGFDRAGDLTAVRLSSRGRADRGFGHDGAARYKLAGAHGATIIAAAAVQANGDILAVYQREVPQPVNEPSIAKGLGEGPIELVRLLPSGALDRSFGNSGFLTAAGQTPALGGYPGNGLGWASAETIALGGSLLLAYEQAFNPSDRNVEELPAIQQLDPTGADASAFGAQGAVYLPFVPGNSKLCDGLFGLPGGAVEAGFGGQGPNSTGVELFRFASTGALDPAFGGSGYVKLGVPVAALAVGVEGETFSAGTSGGALVLGGTLSSGAPDPSLGGAKGMRFAANLSKAAGATVEALAGAEGISVRVGEQIVRISR